MEDYPDNIRPDQLYKVPINGGGELTISPAYDILHYFPWLDCWILRYWNTDKQPSVMTNIMMANADAERLISNLDMEVCSRTFITASEIEMVREFGAAALEQTFKDEFPPEK